VFRCYLEDILRIGDSIARNRVERTIHKDKVGQNIFVGVDEAQRMLVMCAPQKVTFIVSLGAHKG
jgi:hypothetical protein